MVKYFLVFISLFYSSRLHAQWEESEKTEFLTGCKQYALTQGIGEAESGITCNCVLQKFLIKYPRAKDAAEHGGKHIARYTLMCLPHKEGTWHSAVQNQFTAVCQENARSNGKIKDPVAFCICMLKQFQTKYSQTETLNLSEKDKNLKMLEMGSNCMYEDEQRKK